MNSSTKKDKSGLLSIATRTLNVLVVKPVRIVLVSLETLEDALLVGNQSVKAATDRAELSRDIRNKIKLGELEAEMNEALLNYAEKSVDLQKRVNKLSAADKAALMKRKESFHTFDNASV